MRLRHNFDLILIGAVSLLLIPAVIFSSSPVLRIILGLPFLIFFPGYTLISALFPARSRLGVIERIAYSLALSISLVALVGLLLNYIWSISLYPILISLETITIATLVIAWLRRQHLPDEERLIFRINLSWGKSAALDRILIILLVLVIISAGITAVYTGIKNIQPYTEFYLLGANGKAEDYPQQLALGQQGQVTLVLVNHEQQSVSYSIKISQPDGQVMVNEQEQNEINVVLADSQKQSYTITFSFDTPGEGKKLEFTLYKNGSQDPFLTTYLKVKITG